MTRIGERRGSGLWLAGIVVLALAACSAGPNERIGAVAGGAAGGLAGAQVGDGRGQLAATAAGAGLGALLGAEAGRRIDAADRMRARVEPGRYRGGRFHRDRYDPRLHGGDWYHGGPYGYHGPRRYGPREPYARWAPRIVADPTQQVPIPGAKVPGGGFWAWLPDVGSSGPMRNVATPVDPAADPACSTIDRPTLKPAYRCTRDGVRYVVQ